MKELCKRVQNCEDSMMEKENDLAYLKFNLHDLKKHFNKGRGSRFTKDDERGTSK